MYNHLKSFVRLALLSLNLLLFIAEFCAYYGLRVITLLQTKSSSALKRLILIKFMKARVDSSLNHALLEVPLSSSSNGTFSPCKSEDGG